MGTGRAHEKSDDTRAMRGAKRSISSRVELAPELPDFLLLKALKEAILTEITESGHTDLCVSE